MKATAIGPEGPLPRPRQRMKPEAPSTRAIAMTAAGSGSWRNSEDWIGPGTARTVWRDWDIWWKAPVPVASKVMTASGTLTASQARKTRPYPATRSAIGTRNAICGFRMSALSARPARKQPPCEGDGAHHHQADLPEEDTDEHGKKDSGTEAVDQSGQSAAGCGQVPDEYEGSRQHSGPDPGCQRIRQKAERCNQPGKCRWVEIWQRFANSGRDRRKEDRRVVDRRPTMGSAELGGEVIDVEVRLDELVVKGVGPLEVD